MPRQSHQTILLATDQQRSVLNALDANRPHPIAYTPYGHRSGANGLLSLLGFNGELPDPMTGHYHLGKGYRQFNPVLMRFNSPDSWSPFGEGGLNPYVFCEGDPVNKSDPTGHIPITRQLLKEVGRFAFSGAAFGGGVAMTVWGVEEDIPVFAVLIAGFGVSIALTGLAGMVDITRRNLPNRSGALHRSIFPDSPPAYELAVRSRQPVPVSSSGVTPDIANALPTYQQAVKRMSPTDPHYNLANPDSAAQRLRQSPNPTPKSPTRQMNAIR